MISLKTTALLYSLAVTSVLAAPDPAPVPRLGTAPDSSTWTVTYQYKTPNPYLKPPSPAMAALYEKLRNQNPRVLDIEVTKAGGRRKEIMHLDNQTEAIRWVTDGLLFWENPSIGSFLIYNEKDPTSPRYTHDFESLSWVDQAEYKGHQTMQDVDCCVYSMGEGGQTAYIGFKTGLPVSVQQGGVTMAYAFRPFAGTIELSPQVEAKRKAYLISLGP